MDQVKQDQPKTSYQLYLETPHWAMFREACFRRDGFKCVSCRSSFQINAHHWIYRNLTDCTVHDVMTLCGDCHGHVHDHMKINGIRSGFLGPLDVLAILRRFTKKLKTFPERVPVQKMVEAAEPDPVFPPEGDGPFVITWHFFRMWKTDAGGYTKATLKALGLDWKLPPKWADNLIGTEITKEALMKAYDGRLVMTKKGARRARAREARQAAAQTVSVNFKAA